MEQLRRSARSVRVRDEMRKRKELIAGLSRNYALEDLIDKKSGYGHLPAEAIPAIPAAIKYAQKIRDGQVASRRSKKKQDYNPTIHEPKQYEDAPAFFDLALSDEILQVASDYLGEIPVLLHIKLWCSPVNEQMKGSQLYHRDGRQWTLRRAKFLINMDEVDAECGPFTFMPADVSDRVSNAIGSMKQQGRVTDKTMFRHAAASDTVSLIGPAGTGAAVDSSRCFHHGARVRKGERLILMFHFLSLSDALYGGHMHRSQGFDERFGDDPIRRMAVPHETA
jgi:hypothetical protein